MSGNCDHFDLAFIPLQVDEQMASSCQVTLTRRLINADNSRITTILHVSSPKCDAFQGAVAAAQVLVGMSDTKPPRAPAIRFAARPEIVYARNDQKPESGAKMRSAEVQGPTTLDGHWGALQTTWERRSIMAAEWLQDARIVADAGCGLMTLEALLPTSTTYIPMDVVPRDGRTIVFDLNKDKIPAVACDVLVMLGVLEYGDNVASIFSQLHQFPKVLFSYNHVSVNDVLWRLGLRTKHVTWRNRHTRASLRRLLAASNLRIVRERRIRVGERLYEVASR